MLKIPMKTGEVFEFGEFRIDSLDRTLRRHESPVVLQRRAFDVLLYLVRNPGRVVTKDELLKNVWPEAFVDENNLSQSISVLRKALDDHPGANTYITTLPGRGYQFVAPVKVVGHEADEELEGSQTNVSATTGLLLHQRTITSTRVITEQNHETQGRWMRLGPLLVVLVLLASAGGYVLWLHFHTSVTSVSVVTGSFVNSTGDAAFDRTLDRALEIDLSQSPYMDVLSEGEVVSALHYMGRPGDTPLSADLARQICMRSNREAVLTGAISSVGRKYLLTLEATNCVSGKEIAAAKAVASSKEDVLAALDSVAEHVRHKLGESAESMQSYHVPIVQATTPSLEALQAYSMGDYLVSQGKDENESLPLFQKAVELDPQFAMAYGQIANDYYNLSEFDQASLYYAKAFQLSGNVSEKEKLILQAHYYAEGKHDLVNGIKTYTLWADTYPFDWPPLVNLCNQYTQLGNYAPAIEAGERAVKLQPDRGITYSVLARALMRANRFADAKAVGAMAEQRGKDSVGVHETLYEIAVHEQDSVALAAETKWAAAHTTGWYGWFYPYSQAEAMAMTGSFRQAESLFRIAYEIARDQKASESADDLLMDQARIEFDFGLPALAKSTLRNVQNQSPDVPDLPVLYAQLGDTSAAQRYLAAYANRTDDTQMMHIYLPKVRAALAMKQGKPLEAIAALEAARPFELVDFSILTLRASAYLMAKDPERAAKEYQTILAHPGLDPDGYLYLMAHLGLARSLAIAGRTDESRAEYKVFLKAWKDADPDLPILKQANAELVRL
jgi:DNA-binding winged helix-turn-helix (wHTH) protein/tetratricopeptide (TPR) repeat protein